MQNNFRNKLLTGAVILLLLANVASLSIYWWTNRDRKGEPRSMIKGRSAAAQFLIDQLEFDTAQQNAYAQLIKEHQDNTRGISEAIRDSKKQLFDLLADEREQQSGVRQALDSIGRNESLLQWNTFEHFKKVRALCNDRQKKKFDAIIQEVIRMMVAQHPGPPPPNRSEGDRPPPPDQQHDPMQSPDPPR